MKLCFVFHFIIIQILCSFSLFAQQAPLKLTLFANFTFPNGHFEEKIGDNPRITNRFGFDYGKNAGLANNGYGVGAEASQQALAKNLHWIISARFLSNSVDHSQISSFFHNELGDSVNVSFENGKLMNIPILTGFSYDYTLLPDVRIYALLQGGLNITRQPYRKVMIDGEVVEETTFRTALDFGFEVGFGVEIKNKYNVGIRYLNLSIPRYEGSRRLNESFFTSIPKRVMNVDGDERPIAMFVLFLGYSL